MSLIALVVTKLRYWSANGTIALMLTSVCVSAYYILGRSSIQSCPSRYHYQKSKFSHINDTKVPTPSCVATTIDEVDIREATTFEYSPGGLLLVALVSAGLLVSVLVARRLRASRETASSHVAASFGLFDQSQPINRSLRYLICNSPGQSWERRKWHNRSKG